MTKLAKKRSATLEKMQTEHTYPISEAITFLKENSQTKFVESLDISVNLGIDSKKSDQNIRGSVVLPNGSGKNVRVAVFCQGEKAEEAKKAGADIVGMEDLVASMKKGNLDYDVVIAATDAMALVGQLGQTLGPKGLMPNPKVGTVTNDIGKAVENAKSGQVQYRNDKAGIIHASVGKLDFSSEALLANISALLSAVKKAKPSNAKGIYFKKLTLSSTMGVGLAVDLTGLV